MENEANPVVIPMPMDVKQSPCSLFTKIRSAASKFIHKIFKNDQPSFNLEPPPTVSVVVVRSTPTSPEETMNPIIRRRGLQHPIFKLIEEHKLGKSLLNIAAPAVVAVLVSGSSKTLFAYIMVSGVCFGCAGILNGILLRETFPRGANVIELLGTVLALICLNGLVGSFIPTEFIWLPILSGVLCLFPFIIMVLY